jgi:uncharacterized membrane protein
MNSQSMNTTEPMTAGSAVERSIRWSLRNALLVILLFLIVLVVLPWLAPLFMKMGWDNAGHVVYRVYSFLCHQLPQRSFFLFGQHPTYSLEQLQAVGVNTTDILELRGFIGTPVIGYKVAWSDRMVSLYSSLPLAGLTLLFLGKRTPRLPMWGLLLLTLPMVVDGVTHLVSDLSGIGQGFRATNEWLVSLTGGIFPDSFYTGAGLGSFNSWMRLVTGAMFGLGLVLFTFPALVPTFTNPQAGIDRRLPGEGYQP